MKNWLFGLIGYKSPEYGEPGKVEATEWLYEPCPCPTILITSEIKNQLEKGVKVSELYDKWSSFFYSHMCRVFPTPEAAKEFIKTQPPGKWHLFTETSHVCTEAVFKEDC